MMNLLDLAGKETRLTFGKATALEYDAPGPFWPAQGRFWRRQLSGTAAGVKSDSLQAEILEELDELGGEATAADLAKRINRDRSNVRKELLELVAKGAVARCEKVGREVHYQKV
jgi:predicted HTH transcriptional regulator